MLPVLSDTNRRTRPRGTVRRRLRAERRQALQPQDLVQPRQALLPRPKARVPRTDLLAAFLDADSTQKRENTNKTLRKMQNRRFFGCGFYAKTRKHQ